MSSWYEIFDNEHVQHTARWHAIVLTSTVVGMLALSAAGVTLNRVGVLSLPVTGALLTAGWLLTVNVLVQRLSQLRRTIWCVKLSRHKIVGYDYARRTTEIAWANVERIDLAPSEVIVFGPNAARLDVSHLFSDFPKLSRRIVEYSMGFGVPVFVHGQPLEELDVYRLFPALQDAAE